jgi:hypothetical protein
MLLLFDSTIESVWYVNYYNITHKDGVTNLEKIMAI